MGVGEESIEVLLDADTIHRRVVQIGAEIGRDFQGTTPVLVGVLTGAALFLADLVRNIPTQVELDFVAVSSYGESTRSSGEVRVVKDVGHPVEGRDILIVEDIVDTGLTLRYLIETLHARRPASVSTCVLLDKPTKRLVNVPVRYRGFEIEDRFVVGYGLDYAGLYRNLPYIGVLPSQP
jgi:hypoxanthine phosphoribosyltransferase